MKGKVMLRFVILVLVLWADAAAALDHESDDRVEVQISTPRGFTGVEAHYARRVVNNPQSTEGYLGLSLGRFSLDADDAMTQNDAVIYFGTQTQRGFFTDLGVGYEAIKAAENKFDSGFLYYRFGIMGESSFHARFGFGVDWRLYFKDRQIGDLKLSDSPVTPFVCGIFDL